MFKKAIVFDVDGVILDSWSQKDTIIENILEKYGVLHIPWVREILIAWLNRVLIVEKINELHPVDKQALLHDINRWLRDLENSVNLIESTWDFIRMNFEKYNFFTNTSLPKSKLQKIFSDMDIGKYFLELLAYDDGSKKENIEYIMQVYNILPENVLFIDDKISHLEAVKDTGVHTLLFQQDGVSLEEKVNNIF